MPQLSQALPVGLCLSHFWCLWIWLWGCLSKLFLAEKIPSDPKESPALSLPSVCWYFSYLPENLSCLGTSPKFHSFPVFLQSKLHYLFQVPWRGKWGWDWSLQFHGIMEFQLDLGLRNPQFLPGKSSSSIPSISRMQSWDFWDHPKKSEPGLVGDRNSWWVLQLHPKKS